MPGTGPRVRNWTFTLNNYTPDDVDRLSTPNPLISYIIFGKEEGSGNQTRHLQGFVCFSVRKRLTGVRALISMRAHYEVAKYTWNSIEYCKKEGDFTEVGDRSQVPFDEPNRTAGEVMHAAPAPAAAPQRQRREKEDDETKLEDLKTAINGGTTSIKELRESHSYTLAKYSKFASQYVRDKQPKPQLTVYPLHPWQETLNAKLILPAGDREIIFIVDSVGAQGKSWFAKYYMRHHEKTQLLSPAKKADMARFVEETTRVFFFDCPRSKSSFLQYDFLEELKNGYIFSPKYDSCSKELCEIPHVVVMMNEHPDMTRLSADRYSVTVLT